jgi:large subunit ribosomal protein L18Ae
VEERNPRIVKNYGIWLRYRSRYTHHNLYKEYRDVSRTGAVNQMYSDMAGQYHATYKNIQIIDIKEVDAKNCRRENTKQFHNSKIKFPLPHRVLRPSSRKYRSVFKAHRPTTHFG